MDCPYIEDRLSEYLEQNIVADQKSQVEEHLQRCGNCSALLEEMRSLLVSFKAFPTLQPDLELIERILLRTSGRPRTRTVRELMERYFMQLFTPRFAAGAGLAVLFLGLSVNFLVPRVVGLVSLLSPEKALGQMDRAVQQIYSQGMKAYDKKNEWQAQFTFFKNNIFNRLEFVIEQLDVPEDRPNSSEPVRPRDKVDGTKSSIQVWLA